MCVQRTMVFGIWFGIASGMDAATAHGLLSLVLLIGLGGALWAPIV